MTLVERDPVIYGVWSYLIKVRPPEIMKLPSNIDSLDELPPWVPEEARNLTGLWFNRALPQPAKHRSQWAQQPLYAAYFWGEMIKLRLAGQVDLIKPWKIIEGDYTKAPNAVAHYHIDPPYSIAGQHYRYNGIDYDQLAEWCLQRRGFVQICEAAGATWLPFKTYARTASHRARGFRAHKFSPEALYEIDTDAARYPRARNSGASPARDRNQN